MFNVLSMPPSVRFSPFLYLCLYVLFSVFVQSGAREKLDGKLETKS